MYIYLLFFHSTLRWIVLLSLLYAIYRGARGWLKKGPFTGSDNTVRHVTTTITHLQLAAGYILYFTSPLLQYIRGNFREVIQQPEYFFWALIHILLMTISVVLITIGSSLSKGKESSEEQFRTMTIWFTLGLLIIFIAIPWPFSPLANRPYLRPF